ncbi:MAG TPA: ABC transporter permease [Dictyoglomaceae bacterium]|nr:ABC transporter permease [Dictyoglomaceae bacterium]
MKSFLSVALYRLKSFYRDKFTFFFSLILPMIIIIIFGFVFGGSSEELPITNISVLKSQGNVAEVVKELEGTNVILVEKEDEMRDMVLKGDADCGVIFDGNKFKLLINFTSFQQKPFLRNLGSSISTLYSKKEAGIEEKFIKVEEETIDPGKAKITDLGYMIPGVVSFSIGSAMFLMIALFGYYRKEGILKRFAVTPVSASTLISGMLVGNFLVSLASCTLVLLISQFLFGIRFAINWVLYLISAGTSILGMMALGILLSSVFKEPQTANNVANLILNVMAFFSGIYFPLGFLPDYLKTFAKFLPLYYIGRSLRMSVGAEEISMSFILLFSLVMLGVFILFVTIFGRGIFEMEEK